MSAGCIALLGAPLSPPPRREAAARPRPTFPARPFFRRLRPQGGVLAHLAGIPAGPARGAAPGGARLPVSQLAATLWAPTPPPPATSALASGRPPEPSRQAAGGRGGVLPFHP
ncbi:PREDICTED: formin-like protein 18 [Bison bison bison]|uniref:Formin-like protein 18 n=1 Tax=Bison bison bison TaxID=43346 RepID=A0A6P3J0Q1_BISBB|nr:PREDICTED: formin-like protein 18 [Bison bison bison]